MKFFNISKANEALEAASAAIQPDLEKAGITTAMRDGKQIPIADATLAEKIIALRVAQPTGTDLQLRAELLESNATIAARCEKAESDLAIAKTTVATLQREKADLETRLSTKQGAVQTLTSQKAQLEVQLKASSDEFGRVNRDLAAVNATVSEMCVNAGCLELKGEDGKALAADATQDEKLKAANAIPIADKLTAYKGAVNAALVRVGIPAGTLPGGAPGGVPKQSIGQAAILAQYEAISDSVERVTFYREHKAAIDSAYKNR
jgi:hypothetical protein